MPRPSTRTACLEQYFNHRVRKCHKPPLCLPKTLAKFVCLLLAQALGWLLLAIYLDNVLPGPNKRARPPGYFLMPSYWVRTRGTTCGLSHKQQHELLSQARHRSAAQHGTAHAGGTPARLSLGSGPKQPAQLQEGRTVQTAWQQQQGLDARLDMGCTANGGSTLAIGGGTDEDVAAEEAGMQALLGELLPFTAAARRRSAGAHVYLKQTGQCSAKCTVGTASW